MRMRIFECTFKGHKIKENMINPIYSVYRLGRCNRCGFYVMQGEIGSVIVTKRNALKIKRDFEEKFPYSVKGE